jgi:hypothetical protein
MARESNPDVEGHDLESSIVELGCQPESNRHLCPLGSNSARLLDSEREPVIQISRSCREQEIGDIIPAQPCCQIKILSRSCALSHPDFKQCPALNHPILRKDIHKPRDKALHCDALAPALNIEVRVLSQLIAQPFLKRGSEIGRGRISHGLARSIERSMSDFT